MTQCNWCGVDCDKSIGAYRETKIVEWGGPYTRERHSYTPKEVLFFCSHEHRTNYWLEP